jgi:chromosome segregation ATPase
MVIEKLETLEASLKIMLEELEALRRGRAELESQVELTRSEAHRASAAATGRDEEVNKLREENTRLQGERNEVRERVERILNNLPTG